MLELKHIMFERDNKKILNDINLTSLKPSTVTGQISTLDFFLLY